MPTGVIADTYSRRLSVTLAMFGFGASFLLEGALAFFPAILLAQVVRGAGHTLVSGALEAWITDEVGEAAAPEVFLRGSQAGTLGGLAGIVASVALATVQINLPVLVSGGLFVSLGVFLLVAMPETGFKPQPRSGRAPGWKEMGRTMGEGVRIVRHRPVVLTILLIGIVFGAFSEGLDRLWEAHFMANFSLPPLLDFSPLVWFGILNLGGMGLSLLLTEIIRRKLNLTSPVYVARALMIINGLLIGSVAAFALSGNFGLAVGSFWLTGRLRHLNSVLYTAWLNQNIASRARATVLSIGSQFDALGQFVGGPLLGLVATTVSIPAALFVSALSLAPALLLYGRSLRQQRQAQSGGGSPILPLVADEEPATF